MDTPIRQIVHRPEAQAGLGCMMCHSIAQVKSTMGQGDFYLEYPKMHELAASKNPVIRSIHDFLTYLNPEPHRRTFLKPFMRNQTAEFCSSCHKVHLDVPVNHYRWFRGFNEYDNWQASGVSGYGARSFYYPPKPQQCADCHMPLQKSADAGNIAGFFGANAEQQIYYGFKTVVTKQSAWIPGSALLMQGHTPTGGPQSVSQVRAGYVLGWTLPNRWNFDAAMRFGTDKDEHGGYRLWAPSVVLKIPLTPSERWFTHVEYFGVVTQGKENDTNIHFVDVF
jgi:hypothetical protein